MEFSSFTYTAAEADVIPSTYAKHVIMINCEIFIALHEQVLIGFA
jgi:hypothetical protein